MYTYIHIPKTAGNSIIHSGNRISSIINHSVEIGKIDVTKLGINKSKNSNPMTVVRNPYSRFISAYNYLKSGGLNTKLDLYYSEILNSISLDEFLSNLHIYMFEIIHFVPQHYFTSTNISKITIFKLENLIGSRSSSLKINKHHNKTSKIFITELTESQREIIRRLYSLDFELFGY